MTTDLDALSRSVARATRRDGIEELSIGVVLFVIALATGRPAFSWMYLVVILMPAIGVPRLKARYSYPRIGYAELPSDNSRVLGVGMILYILGAFLLVAVVLAARGEVADNLAWRQWAPLLAGLLFSGGFLHVASLSGLRRYYAFVVIAVSLGWLLSTQTFTAPYGGVRVWALVMSLLLMGTGFLQLRSFIRAHPIVEERGPDGD